MYLDTNIPLWSSYLLTGILSSFFSGLLGIGGGLVIIPALMFIFAHFHVVDSQNLMHLVIGTSLASSILNLVFSVRAHHKKGNVRWSVFYIMCPGVLIGTLLVGPHLMSALSGNTLKTIFGVSCLFFSIQMIYPRKNSDAPEKLPGKVIMTLLGIITGTLSVLLGLAGGAIIGTALNYYHMEMRRIVGTTASVTLILATAGTIGLMTVSYHLSDLPPDSIGFIYWPALVGIVISSPFFAPLGVKVAQRLPVHLLKKMFAAFVLIIGLKMLL